MARDNSQIHAKHEPAVEVITTALHARAARVLTLFLSQHSRENALIAICATRESMNGSVL
jgi:hypothetical protein